MLPNGQQRTTTYTDRTKDVHSRNGTNMRSRAGINSRTLRIPAEALRIPAEAAASPRRSSSLSRSFQRSTTKLPRNVSHRGDLPTTQKKAAKCQDASYRSARSRQSFIGNRANTASHHASYATVHPAMPTPTRKIIYTLTENLPILFQQRNAQR